MKKKKKEDILEFSSNLSIDLSHDLINFKNTKYKKKAQLSQTSAESEISVKSHWEIQLLIPPEEHSVTAFLKNKDSNNFLPNYSRCLLPITAENVNG